MNLNKQYLNHDKTLALLGAVDKTYLAKLVMPDNMPHAYTLENVCTRCNCSMFDLNTKPICPVPPPLNISLGDLAFELARLAWPNQGLTDVCVAVSHALHPDIYAYEKKEFTAINIIVAALLSMEGE